MTKYEQVIEAFRGQRYRLTPQRLLILDIVAQGGGHMGVDEVFRQAKEAYPYMDLATVYRTLHVFKRLGVVTEVVINDRLHYEFTDPDDAHHHMVCQVCNGAYNLSPRYLDKFRDILIREFGFEPDLDHFAITGVCTNCRGVESTQNG